MPELKMTDLDNRLREMAMTNWPQFAELIGIDAITAAKICLLRGQKKSYGEIRNKLGISEKQARYGCNKCDK